eukprot:NODE_4824_length_446_cov_76.649874_g4167_i0.p5 GENE.NODE_4824_length_446_cov_76.649874_g4167_i0~~NODE_4824_length_446_cov_76.649874_g4167_i0.p5  ORF type:complete len:50 (-),score=7.90 NODE_4824_length_446_cov_76.649874_g4167_i0:3-152(-)
MYMHVKKTYTNEKKSATCACVRACVRACACVCVCVRASAIDNCAPRTLR